MDSKSAAAAAKRIISKIGPRTALVLWLAAAAIGMHVEWSYAATPGPSVASVSEWPAGATLTRKDDRPTLLVFAYPRCPSTRATMNELSQILEQTEQPVDTIVAFVRPGGVDDAWMHSDVWEAAAKLPNARIVIDPNGAEAARFSAVTSGTVLVYDKAGKLQFSGGITALRGHAGDNSGEERVSAVLAGRVPDERTHPVFGCALQGPALAPALASSEP